MAKSKCFKPNEVQNAYLVKLNALTEAEGHKSKPVEYWAEIVPHSFECVRGRFDFICEEIDYCSTKLESNNTTSFEQKFFKEELASAKSTLSYIEKTAFRSIQKDIQEQWKNCNDINFRIGNQQGKFQKYLEKIVVLSGISMGEN